MSRSYHSNIRKFVNEKKYQYSNDDIKEENLNQIGEELYRKRFTKRRVILSRKIENRKISYNNRFNPDAVNIRVLDEGKYIHYPVSKEDLIGVIKRLPHNVVSGIHSITLCLGKEYMESKDNGECEKIRDPFTARICSDEDGSIYTPPILGTYYTGSCKIFIYAYVYDRDKLRMRIIEPYLRLQMLGTLAHEIAHHEDNILRTNRGRWLGFNDWKCEDYAELQNMHWAETAVVPYLMATYPDEYSALSDWIQKYGGVRFPLEKLAGESHGRRIGDRVKIVFSASSAVEDLFKDIDSGMDRRDAMLEFARDLHTGDYYDECLEVLKTLLSNNPEDSDALGVKADTYIHMGEYKKAEEAASRCLSIDSKNIDALEALCEVKQNIKDWTGLKEISRLGIESAAEDALYVRAFTQMLIVALLYLKEYEEAERKVYTLPCNKIQARGKSALEALVKLCSGDKGSAFKITETMLMEDDIILPVRAIVKAVSNFSAPLQEEGTRIYELNENEKNYLNNTAIAGLLKL